MNSNNSHKSSTLSLSKQEQEVIELIRGKKLSSLKIKFDHEGKITFLEATETFNKIDTHARYLDHLLKNGHQDISFSTNNGKIVHYKKTTKRKLT